MSGSSQDKTQLAKLVAQLAVVHGKVTLSSGIEADYYVDLRRATLHHEAAVLVGKVMLNLFAEAGLKPDAVGGLTMGADPVASAMLHQASATVLAIATVVDRDTGARAAIESAGYAYYSALSLSDLGL